MKHRLLFLLLFLILTDCKPSANNQIIEVKSTPTPLASPVQAGSPASTREITSVLASNQNTMAAPLISWADYDIVYNVKSRLTKTQKEAEWWRFAGHYVIWEGTFDEISEEMPGRLIVSIKMNKETRTSDVVLLLKKNQRLKAAKLSRGDKIIFSGKFINAGDQLLPLAMDEGEIK